MHAQHKEQNAQSDLQRADAKIARTKQRKSSFAMLLPLVLSAARTRLSAVPTQQADLRIAFCVWLSDEADLAAEVERKKALVADLSSNHNDQARQRDAARQPLRTPAPASAGAPTPISPVSAAPATIMPDAAPPAATTTAQAPATLTVEERELQEARANAI